MKYQSLAEIDSLVLAAQKPSRYVGRELNSVVKDLAAMRATWTLCFPDTYEVGMSNLGFRVLYHLLNARADVACERAFMPWPDMAALQRAQSVPLWSLESRVPLKDFDILGFSLQFEACYTTCLEMLDLAGLPVLAADRDARYPLVIAGGPCTMNGEPVAPFFDAMVIGDGEEVVHEISNVVIDWKSSSTSRDELLRQLARIPGVYVPSLFKVNYHAHDRTVAEIVPLLPGYERVTRRVVADLNAVPGTDRPLVPFMQAVHDRLPLEIQRGCVRGCRFCQAGMTTRPARQRHPDQVLQAAVRGLANSGWEEVGFLSLSAGDYGCINPLLEEFLSRFAPERIAVSLPSLRTETMNESLAQQIAKVKKTGFTIAPEAATERLRQVINKNNTEESLLQAVQSVFRSGWSMVKLYFMIGLPTETDQDVLAIADLAKKAHRLSRAICPSATINASVSTFVPKPFTPFQWEPMIGVAQTIRKHDLLRGAFPRKGSLLYKYHDAKSTMVEGALARGDRRVASAVLAAWRAGQVLDSWTEHFSFDRWEQAFQEMERQHQVSMDFMACRERAETEVLPWDHIDVGVRKEFLWAERSRAYAAQTLGHCLNNACSGCGVCDHQTIKNRVYEAGQTTINGSQPNRPIPQEPSSEQQRFLVRLRYGKLPRAVALSHLEITNALLRALRRSLLPVAYSQGFNPRPRVSLGPACPVGVESNAEFCDVEMTTQVTAAQIEQALGPQMPQLLPLLEVTPILLSDPSLASSILKVRYRLCFVPGTSAEELARRLASFAQAPQWDVIRESTKKSAALRRRATNARVINLKEVVTDLELLDDQQVIFHLKAGNEASAKPSEVLQSLFAGLTATAMIKESVVFRPPPLKESVGSAKEKHE